MTKKQKVVCGECGSNMVLRKGKYGQFYGCPQYPKCTGIHGAHPDGSPLGIPADKETRTARIKAHDVFDAYWRKVGKRRRTAYKELEEIMGMDYKHAHIGRFTKEECDFLIEYLGG